MSKRPLLFLVAGFICAGAAVLIVSKHLGGGRGGKTEMGQVLLATRDIAFGTELIAQTRAKGEEQNVGFYAWPKAYIPADAIRGEEFLKGKTLRANVDMFGQLPVLKAMVVEDQDFIPQDMYSAPIDVNPKDIVHAQPGRRVDVFQGSGDRLRMVMRGVRVLPPPKEKKGDRKKRASTAYLLIAKKDIDLFLKLSDGGKLRLAPSQVSSGPMEFVELDEPQVDPVAEQMSLAETLIQKDQLEEAHRVLATMEEEALDPAQKEARNSALVECESLLAEKLYDEAELALAAKDYEQCRRLCQSIARQYPRAIGINEEATRLEARAVASSQQDRYVEDQEGLNKLLASGNLPEANRELTTFREIYAAYEPPSHLVQPEVFASDYERQIEAKERAFKLMQQVLEHYVSRREQEKALAKLDEMRQTFPEHPYVEQMEKKLRGNLAASAPQPLKSAGTGLP